MNRTNRFEGEGKVVDFITDGFILEITRKVKVCDEICEEKTIVDCKLSAFGGPKIGSKVRVVGQLKQKYWTTDDDREISDLYIDCERVEVMTSEGD